ncbi:MAG: hypothetical protein ACRD5L_11840, partial [Bryobacteraceae bacterium]
PGKNRVCAGTAPTEGESAGFPLSARGRTFPKTGGGEKAMSSRIVIRKVDNWLRSRPGECFCDDCITQLLGTEERKDIQRVTSILSNGHNPDFSKYPGRCDGCGGATLVTIASPNLSWAI